VIAAPPHGAPPLAQALLVAAVAWQQFLGGRTLEVALAEAVVAVRPAHPRAAAAAKDIVYGATRQKRLLETLVERLTTRPPSSAVAALLTVALSQLLAERHAPHVVVDQAVECAKRAASTVAASGFINAVLRRALRERDTLLAPLAGDDAVQASLPDWWLQKLRDAHPRAWREIVAVQRLPAPLVLRVDEQQLAVEDYLARLGEAGIAATRVGRAAVWLHTGRDVHAIPGFDAGLVSVQDAGAQLAAPWLAPPAQGRVLDACAAPGGKTLHLAQRSATQRIDALDVEAVRLQRIAENLRRAAISDDRVRLREADAARPDTWWDGEPYDAILLDAPCTASGIVRRHPDVPWLRRSADVAQLARAQERLLQALWPLLRPAGRLLYVVCSLFPEEGEQQARRFLQRNDDARAVDLPGGAPFVQLLPAHSAHGEPWPADREVPLLHDGFFYALFEKRASGTAPGAASTTALSAPRDSH
jgi:16S rRNA (cytosine967-C5)-methyltransferase